MKVAIITMSNGINYGNRLQNYAVQEVLRGLNCDVETIRNFTNQKIVDENSLKEKLKDLSAKLNYIIPFTNIRRLQYILRERRFFDFNKKYISQTNYKITKDNIPYNLDEKYDYFICGSDQIWNPEFDINSQIDFLSFASKGKRIAYSPSFGISCLPNYCKDDYMKWINQIDYLSIREKAGADIIKDLTGRNAEILLDPTLMLSKNEWMLIAKKPKLRQDLNKKFILTYFLGDKDENTKRKIDNIAKNNNLQIIDLLDKNNKFIYSIDPSEFIWLINNCSLMCTDSFHGTVFSLIMKVPFIVFERIGKETSMNSRLENLLDLFNMKNRTSVNVMSNEEFNIDFSHVEEIINKEKQKTYSFLKKALDINN